MRNGDKVNTENNGRRQKYNQWRILVGGREMDQREGGEDE